MFDMNEANAAYELHFVYIGINARYNFIVVYLALPLILHTLKAKQANKGIAWEG